MTVTLTVYVEDIAGVLAEGYTTLRLFRDTSPDGAFSTQATTATLVAGQEFYPLTDTSGTFANWYRHDFYDGVAVATAKSPPYRSEAVPLSLLRVMVAARTAAGRHSTCTATGTVSSLIDAKLRDNGFDAKYLEGSWVYRPAAALTADKLRRTAIDGFGVSAGSLRPIRDWTNAPESGEAYQVFSMLPPVIPDTFGSEFTYTDAINQALNEPCIDMVNLGEGTTAGKTTFALNLWGISANDIRAVYLRTTDDNSIDTYQNADKNGRYCRTRTNGPGDLSVELHPPPGTDETVIIEVNRRYPALYGDDDVTEAPLEHIIRCAKWKAFEYLNTEFEGRYAAQAGRAHADWLEEYAALRPTPVVRGL